MKSTSAQASQPSTHGSPGHVVDRLVPVVRPLPGAGALGSKQLDAGGDSLFVVFLGAEHSPPANN
ncbi:hypothetical protein ACQPZ8_32395 [Actinomadura nitritigenes]|uniref:hypothetical protein n=1 Tax=Actinomadura nitritigenes TaxID=134602 RepID=UPI003D8C0947